MMIIDINMFRNLWYNIKLCELEIDVLVLTHFIILLVKISANLYEV